MESILADARARAHQLIDESVSQAEALIEQRAAASGAGVSGQILERLRRMVADLAAEVRALHGRLDAIEGLLRSRPAAASPPPAVEPRADAEPAPAPPAPPPERLAPAPPSAERAPPPPPSAERAAPPPPPPAERVSPPSPPPPPEPDRVPAPPPTDEARRAAGIAPERTPGAAREGPPVAAPPPSTSEVAPNGPTDATDATEAESFAPEGGSVQLRVSPVSGFQGLMRVQDTLVRLRAIREASVEAYAQGEARLRLQLAEPVEPASIAGALGEGLGQEARVESASLPERSLQVALS